MHSLSQTPDAAQAELINCILRACGCNDSIDADQAIDYDGVVDALDTFTEGLKQVTMPSHSPDFADFRSGKLANISPHVQTARIQTFSCVPLGAHRTSCSCRRRTRFSLHHRSHHNPPNVGHRHVLLSNTFFPPYCLRRRSRSGDRPFPSSGCRREGSRNPRSTT